MVILPPCRLGERHEDRLDAAAGLEAEDGAPVVDEVELDVAPPPHQLPLLLLLSEGVVLVLLHDGEICLSHVRSAVARKLEDLLGVLVVEVVKEDAAEAAGLATVLDAEVFVGPLLELLLGAKRGVSRRAR